MREILDSPATQQTVTMDHQFSAVEHLHGAAAFALLKDARFIKSWDELQQQCTWATPFQSSSFVLTWYALFREDYTPLLVLQKHEGKLIGLLTLTIGPRGNISFAGTDIAEYQVWLAHPDTSDNFIKQALLLLSQVYKGKQVHLKFIPNGTPMQWTTEPFFKSRTLVKPHKQPLLRIDYTSLAKELQKKNRKEKVNRLKRLGNLQFTRVTDADEFDTILDELVNQSDFRKGAMFDWCPFQQFPTRKAFMSALFRSDILHVSILKLDDKIIASNVGVYGNKWLHLQGINTHCPMHARYSPGILHFLMLGLMLSDEGMEVFDLTPGGDGYKAVLATEYTEAYELTFQSQADTLIEKSRTTLERYVKQQAEKLGYSAYALRNLKKKASIKKQKFKLAKYVALHGVLLRQLRQPLSKAAPTLQHIERVPQPESASYPLQTNSLSDLITYSATGTLQTKWEFLENAMKRFEAEQVCYTWADHTKLLACIWVAIPQKSRYLTIDPAQVPDGATVIEDVYIHPSKVSETDQIIQQLLREVELITPAGPVFKLS